MYISQIIDIQFALGEDFEIFANHNITGEITLE